IDGVARGNRAALRRLEVSPSRLDDECVDCRLPSGIRYAVTIGQTPNWWLDGGGNPAVRDGEVCGVEVERMRTRARCARRQIRRATDYVSDSIGGIVGDVDVVEPIRARRPIVPHDGGGRSGRPTRRL